MGKVKSSKNKQIGKEGERVFIQYLKYIGVNHFRIEDGERYSPYSYVRKRQPFDFILIVKGKPWFVDVKVIDKDTIPLSKFIPKNIVRKMSPTQNQCENFRIIYGSGYYNCYFAILKKYDLDKFQMNIGGTPRFYMLSIKTLILKKAEREFKNKRSTITFDDMTLFEDMREKP